MKVVLIGATGDIGREVVRQSLAAGFDVTALVRRPETVSAENPRLKVMRKGTRRRRPRASRCRAHYRRRRLGRVIREAVLQVRADGQDGRGRELTAVLYHLVPRDLVVQAPRRVGKTRARRRQCVERGRRPQHLLTPLAANALSSQRRRARANVRPPRVSG